MPSLYSKQNARESTPEWSLSKCHCFGSPADGARHRQSGLMHFHAHWACVDNYSIVTNYFSTNFLLCQVLVHVSQDSMARAMLAVIQVAEPIPDDGRGCRSG